MAEIVQIGWWWVTNYLWMGKLTMGGMWMEFSMGVNLFFDTMSHQYICLGNRFPPVISWIF